MALLLGVLCDCHFRGALHTARLSGQPSVTGWFNLIRPAGTATLTTYLVPYVFYGFADVTGVVLPDWFTHGFMGLVNCLCFAFVVIGVTWVMEKLHVKLKI